MQRPKFDSQQEIKPGMAAQAWNPSAQKMEQEAQECKVSLSEFKASLGYTRPCLK